MPELSTPPAATLRHLTGWAHVAPSVWDTCLTRARMHHAAGRSWSDAARGRRLGLLFLAPSLRTRASMELAAAELGAHVTVLSPGQDAWKLEHASGAVMDGDAAEHVRDAVGVLSRYYDALGVRVFAGLKDAEADASDAMLRAVVEAASVPVVSLESARWHPCQALADAAALWAHGGDPAGRRFVLRWAPHPRPLPHAVPNSTLLMAARLGMDVAVCRPPGFELAHDVVSAAHEAAARAGGRVAEYDEPDAVIEGAHVLYAKAWCGRGVYADPAAEAEARRAHAHWRVRAADLEAMDDGAFMHCLPVRRNVVVDDAVLDGGRSLHLLQAEMRIHAQKAMLEHMWGLA